MADELAEILAGRELTRTDIALLFGIPPSMIGDIGPAGDLQAHWFGEINKMVAEAHAAVMAEREKGVANE
jgi:phage portal protein BeeE